MAMGDAPSAWAGAWTLPRNRWYVEYFYRVFQSKHTFDRDGNRVRRPKVGLFRDIRNELKLEYGLTDWWNLLVSAPYLSAHFRDDDTDLLRTGVSDIFLRTKFRLLNRPTFVKGQPTVGSAQFSVKLPNAYDANENPLGDGQVDFESRLQLSQSWAFSPYQAPVPRRADDAATREDAVRDAMIVAELSQRGARLYDEGEYAEAAKWFQAVLETEPSHYEVLRLVLNHGARVIDEAVRAGVPYAMLVREERIEPILADYAVYEQTGLDGDADDVADLTETRYAKVAFANLEGGYTVRNGDPPNEFPLLAELGFTPLKRLMLIGSVESIVSAEPTVHEESFAKWGLRGIVNLWGDGFASVFRTDRPTVNVELGYNDVFAGRNTADAFEIFTKLAINF